MSTFVSPTDIVALSRALSSSVNTLDSAVETAFALLPGEDNLTRGTTCYAVDTGTADAYLIDLPHVPSSYVDGLKICFRPLNSNTGACSVNVNSLGVKSIKLSGNVDPEAGDIPVGAPIALRYSSATSCFHILNSTAQSTVATTQTEVTAARDGETSLLEKQQAQDAEDANLQTQITNNSDDIDALVGGTYPTSISAQIEFRAFGYALMF